MRRQQFLGKSVRLGAQARARRPAHHHPAIGFEKLLVAEEEADGQFEEARNVPQFGDPRFGLAGFHLAQPANGSIECGGQIGKRDPARLSERANIRADMVCGVD